MALLVEWRDVWLGGIETSYEVSNTGRVRNKESGGYIRLHVNSNGYQQCTITVHNRKLTVLVHRLVGQAFIPNPENKPEINHKDGVKTHNFEYNLEWATPSENIQHAYDTGLVKSRVGEKNGYSKYSESQVREACELLQKGESLHTISEATGIGVSNLSDIKLRKTWTHISKDYPKFVTYKKYSNKLIKDIIWLLLGDYKPRHIREELNLPDNNATKSLIDSIRRKHKCAFEEYHNGGVFAIN